MTRKQKLFEIFAEIFPENPAAARKLKRKLKNWRGYAPIKKPDQSTCVLIMYGDSVKSGKEKPLRTAKRFLEKYAFGVISCVHILPFFPYSSDDGFSVIDYKKVNPILGN
jgi:sucrose phosphorylase